MVYRQALDTEKLNRRELEESVARESALVRQQYEAKVVALEAMGILLWARSRKLEATLEASGHSMIEDTGESEAIDAACPTLFGVSDLLPIREVIWIHFAKHREVSAIAFQKRIVGPGPGPAFAI